mmetsp:Transcript_10348/g.19366  ORF Transcript_10348/g.19366 Transcript_10348/m.19366 type:complete len:89 (+) Transcript_10348:341-607(+)
MIAMKTVAGDEVIASQDLTRYLILSHPYQPHPMVLRPILQAAEVVQTESQGEEILLDNRLKVVEVEIQNTGSPYHHRHQDDVLMGTDK